MPVALVTGISRGFGNALAVSLAQAGWHVIGDARDATALVRLGAECENIVTVPGDIADSAHLEMLRDRAAEIGPIDLLVNNAGGLGPSPLPRLADADVEALEALIKVNVLAPLVLIQLCLPAMARDGVIINISSDAAVAAYEGWGMYGATKAALDQVTAVLAAEADDVRFYALDPGDMRTDMHQAAFPGEDISDRPEPVASVPAVFALVSGEHAPGRYKVGDFAQAAA
jgi:NAD(P)-dependent dehydrogenase (short-subunit alcohol dehydrogenase family)